MSIILQKNNFLCAMGLSLSVSFGVVLDATANSVPTKECQPVARDLDSRKTYCAHELQLLKSLKKSVHKSSGILCYLVRQVFPAKALFDLTQCVPPESGYQVDQDSGPIIPKPKGAESSLAILLPLGNTLITSPSDLAWTPIPTATNYRVSLQRGGQWVWSQETAQAKLTLPSKYALQAGGSYKLKVVAFGKEDLVIDENFTFLKLVDPKTLTEIDNAAALSLKSSSSSFVRGIDRAMLFYHAGLVDAAVTQLNSLIKFQEPYVYSQLGLIYKREGQPKVAQGYFKKASELVNQKPHPVSHQETKVEPKRN